MERGSDKHGPRLDEQQKHETEGLVRGGGSTHAEEWKQPEPQPGPGEEDMAAPPYPPDHEPGTPRGLTPEGVERRSTLAQWISGTDVFPADRDALLARAEAQKAPDPVIAALRSLPDGTFTNLADVAETLGYGKEKRGQG